MLKNNNSASANKNSYEKLRKYYLIKKGTLKLSLPE